MKVRTTAAALGLVLSLGACGTTPTTEEPAASETTASQTTKAPTSKPKPAEKKLTTAQENAKRSAKAYVDMSGFSRSGLIKQLKFEGFSAKDAEVAIDSMKVNWNEEADQSAKAYVDMSGFSRSGLVKQLMFVGFTKKQAEHGAASVGL